MDSKDETQSIISANDSAISLSEGSGTLSRKNSSISEFDTKSIKTIKTSRSRRSSRVSTTSSTVSTKSKKISDKKKNPKPKIKSNLKNLKAEENNDTEVKVKKKRIYPKPRRDFLCQVCEKKFLGTSDLRKHLLIHSDERPHECSECNKKFRQAVSLKNHQASIHGIGTKYPCTLCKKTFPIKERLRLHMRLHSGEKPYSCECCSKTFARGGQLRQHMVIHTGIKKYPCDKCSASFSTRSNLKLHLNNHNENIQFRCHICQTSFTRAEVLQRHLDSYHANIKKFHCKICNKTLKGHFHQHMRSHEDIKGYACDICEAEFSQKCQLNVHFRMHSGERPYRCRICWQAFAHSSVLKLHIRKHTGEKPFPCLLCPDDEVSFAQLAHLKTHMRTIHKQSKPYMCIGCNKFFKIKLDLQFHSAECDKLIKTKTNSHKMIHDITDDKTDILYETTTEISKIRLLIAVVLKKISTEERLNALGFEKRLIDNVIVSSLKAANRKYIDSENDEYNEYDRLKMNVEEFLRWTIPESVLKKFKEDKLTLIGILEYIGTFYSEKTGST